MVTSLLREHLQIPDWNWWQRPRTRPLDRAKGVVRVDFQVRNFRVHTIGSEAELKEVLALRRRVFHFEFARKWLSLRGDRDAYDAHADHLAIHDLETGALAGTYRLITAAVPSAFYSSTEFELGRFLAMTGRKLELSRACIAPAYRSGAVISLLWRGIAAYAEAAATDYVFGLSSIPTTEERKIAAITAHLERAGHADYSLGISPLPRYWLRDFEVLKTEAALAGAEDSTLPSLFKSYIRAGAKVCSLPVIDPRFRCADWLTVLDMRQMTAGFQRKYRQDCGASPA